MDKISKALKKLTDKEIRLTKELLFKIQAKDFTNLDLKKLRGYKNIFRVRKGKIRIIFRIDDLNEVIILAIERRTDTTYRL